MTCYNWILVEGRVGIYSLSSTGLPVLANLELNMLCCIGC